MGRGSLQELRGEGRYEGKYDPLCTEVNTELYWQDAARSDLSHSGRERKTVGEDGRARRGRHAVVRQRLWESRRSDLSRSERGAEPKWVKDWARG